MTPAVVALQRRTFRSLRRYRNYRLFFTGQVVSVTGSWMQNVALAWLVIELSSSPLAVGALALCRFLPFTVLSLFGGVLVDRTDTRRLVTWSQGAQMVLSVVLAFVTLTGSATLPLVYVLAAFGGIALAIDAPGRQALTFQLVGPRELPNAVALNSSLFNLSRILGPAIGGLVVAAFGVGTCFAINAVSFLAVLAALRALDLDELYPVERDRTARLIAGLREGVRFAWDTHELRAVLGIIVVTSSLGFNFHVILPLLASETLAAGPEVYGFLAATFGAGAFIGAVSAAALGRASRTVLVVGALGFGISMLALAPLTTAWACAPFLFTTGLSFALLTANANSIVQLRAPDRLRGRMLGIYLFAFAGLAPVGGLLSGWLVHQGGTALSFTVAGVAGVAIALWAARELGVRPLSLLRA